MTRKKPQYSAPPHRTAASRTTAPVSAVPPASAAPVPPPSPASPDANPPLDRSYGDGPVGRYYTSHRTPDDVLFTAFRYVKYFR